MCAITAKQIPRDAMVNENKHVVYMALSMSILSATYEILRSASTALVTSSGESTNVSLLMSLSTPFSLVLLLWFNYEMRSGGARYTLWRTTNTIAFFFVIMNVIFAAEMAGPFSVGMVYLMQESCYHLIVTQQWSFISSVVTPSQGKTIFAPIGGVCSISGAVAGYMVKSLLSYMDISNLFGIGGLFLFVTASYGDYAYAIAEKNGTRTKALKVKKEDEKIKTSKSLWTRSRDLFQRVPILHALACEILACQTLATILNVSYITKLKDSLPHGADRASWTGRFYAIVNGISGTLQFTALPSLMSNVDQHNVWVTIPTIMLFLGSLSSIVGNTSLFMASVSFGSLKIMEYSVRGVATELVYVSLDDESRYSGKQIITTFGVKIAKSLTSFLLSRITSGRDPDTNSKIFSSLTLFTSCLWLYFAILLAKKLKTGISMR
uniref:ADP,ATP carrier protein n=1 Tax=Leptocylindrus danicus TaxID=163516 RepID=A0A7S2PQM4_9STRA|mmetsp:Transcript_8858/g.13112  ORF Transcript_8858/g.13112 Transcript_8858/m.13112 type:complete len:436 (+) Transcript_8858:122-1429(+)